MGVKIILTDEEWLPLRGALPNRALALTVRVLFVLGFFFSVPARALEQSAEKTDEPAPGKMIVCRLKGDVRTLKIVSRDEAGEVLYELFYERDGHSKAVASGRHRATCEHVAQSIQQNLEKANWICRGLKIVQPAEEGV